MPTTARPTRVAFGLGANLGDAEATLADAVRALAAILDEPTVGDLYASPPEDGSDQPPYLNTALVGTTELAPEDLLAVAKSLERRAGRRPAPRDAPRPLDVDLLLHGVENRSDPELALPHPRLRRRSFVLAPLADAAPSLPLPPDGRTAVDLLTEVDRTGLHRIGWSRPPLDR